MIAICFGIHLSFTMSSMLCVHRLRVLHNKHFESTLLSSNIRPILFEFCDPQCVHSIQYGTTLHFNTGKDQKDNTWVVGQARLFWITRELRTQISFNYSIARCRLKMVKKCDALSNNWPLMIGPDGKETIAFRSRKFIDCHSNSSVLNNASVLWCGKKSRMRVLMWGEQKVMFSYSLVKLGEIISISFRKSTVLAVII